MSRNFNPNAGYQRIVLESADGNEELNDDLDLDTASGDGADAALLELQTAASDIDDNDKVQGDLENTVVALESLLEGAQSSLETGGLDPVAADLLQRAVENETAPLGTPANEVVPALESFGAASGRREATVMACEAIMEWVKKTWEQIKALILRGRNLSKQMIIKVVQAVTGLQRRVSAVKKAADGIDANAQKSNTFELKNIAGLQVNGKVDVKANLPKVLAAAKAIFGRHSTEAVKYGEEVAAALEGLDFSDSEKFKASAAKFSSIKRPAVPDAAGLMGGFTLTTGQGGQHGEGAAGEIARNLLGQVVNFGARGANTAASVQAPVLSAADIKTVAGELDALAKEVLSYQRTFEKQDAVKGRVIAAGDKIVSKAQKADLDGESQAIARVLFQVAKSVPATFQNPDEAFAKYATNLIGQVCNYLQANIAQYSKKPKAE